MRHARDESTRSATALPTAVTATRACIVMVMDVWPVLVSAVALFVTKRLRVDVIALLVLSSLLLGWSRHGSLGTIRHQGE